MDWERYSSFSRIIRVIDCIKRFANNRKASDDEKLKGCLKAQELADSQATVWRMVQQEMFKAEIQALKKGEACPTSSQLKAFSPFIDGNGLLRAKGRLRKADAPFQLKHPIPLDSKHKVVELYLQKIQKDNHHEGVEHLQSVIQQEFWIIKLRTALRSIEHKCLVCKKQSAQTFTPEMADLSKERMNDQTFPFVNVGVDFFGPFEVGLARTRLKDGVSFSPV